MATNSNFQRADGRSNGHTDGRTDDRSPPISVNDIQFTAPLAVQLFADIAEAKARAVADGSRDAIKSTQLRRFYDELVMWQAKVGVSKDGTADERFHELAPYIYMLKAKVAYAKGRKHVDDNFETLFRHVIDQAVDAQTLRLAKLFMESFTAFYKVHNK